MIRKIIFIDEAKCTGCGLCAKACHEGAIDLIDGKAKLVREHYCDGLGDCLPQCPTGAITIKVRNAPAYDEQAVLAAKRAKQPDAAANPAPAMADETPERSQLSQWPTQIKLMPIHAPYYQGAKLLVAADCTAFAYPTIHRDFIRGHVTVNGCPKLDAVDYAEKLSRILAANDIQEVLVLRMEVPCCGGLQMAVKRAIEYSGKDIPWSTVTIGTDGRIL